MNERKNVIYLCVVFLTRQLKMLIKAQWPELRKTCYRITAIAFIKIVALRTYNKIGETLWPTQTSSYRTRRNPIFKRLNNWSSCDWLAKDPMNKDTL